MSPLERIVDRGVRRCGLCTLCCTTHSIEDPELNKEAGVPCTHCTVGGCSMYGAHPKACKEFLCEWMKGCGNENHRPDVIGVVFDFVVVSGGLPGGMLQIWEGVPGALHSPLVREATEEALRAGIWVLHVGPKAREKRLFIPPAVAVDEELKESAEENGITICTYQFT